MHRKLILFLVWLAFCLNSARAQHPIIEAYVRQGLESNLALKQQQFSLEQSLKKLTEARGLFLPSVSLEARYSRAGGGRIIDFPVGDLFNPIYATLNEFLTAVGQPPRFPTNLPNQQIPFLREEEQETKIRAIQPIFQPRIYYNYRLQADLSGIERVKTAIFSRQLTADIKSAYLNYLKTAQVIDLLHKTEKLLAENLRVSEKLFAAEMATREVIFRARAELSSLAQQQAEAEKNQRLAGNYFNFLLNRPFDTPILIPTDSLKTQFAGLNLAEAQTIARSQREEFKLIQHALRSSDHALALATSAFLPGIVAVLDYGYQGEQYRFTPEDDYWMASGVLQWNLFNGLQDQARRQQAVLEKRKLEAQLQELEQKIRLQVQEAFDNLQVAQKSISAAGERLVSAQASFAIIAKKYEQGSAPQIEYLDARNQLTQAEINQVLTIFDFHLRQVELERALASEVQ